MTKTDRKKHKKNTTDEAKASIETAAADEVGAMDAVDTVDEVGVVDAVDDAVDDMAAVSTASTVSASSTPSDEPPDSSDEPDSPADEPSASSEARIESLDFSSLAAPEEEEPEAEPLETDLETATVEEIREGQEAPFKSPAEIKAAIECLLFTTPHPLSQQKIRQLVGGIDLRTLRGILVQLQAEYDARGSGLMVIEGAEGFQMCTRPQYADVVLHLHRQRKKNPLSPTALETLAIIAYKQPLTRAEIEMIRGVESSGVLRNLADMGLVEVVGRKEVIGRPQLYGTTAIFLRTFGLRSLAELPTIQNLRRQFEAPTMSMFGGSGAEAKAEAPAVSAMPMAETGAETLPAPSGVAAPGEDPSAPEKPPTDSLTDEATDKPMDEPTDELTDKPADAATQPDPSLSSAQSILSTPSTAFEASPFASPPDSEDLPSSETD